ncbi:uncharacterized protein LOC111635415 [Centruroides sculpturatus]|uniref:uncharacterized protein LOC111635415 n=1 Tax=Centruroides sculpturatus TaxID=218467 RepID=UPI000C6E5158|nr:uncharacterized protein LOC111635415 [Centruroides sculpturatus]
MRGRTTRGCCCFNTEKGSVAVGIYTAVISSAAVVNVSCAFCQSSRIFKSYPLPPDYESTDAQYGKWQRGFLMGILIFHIIWFLSSLLLIYGAIKVYFAAKILLYCYIIATYEDDEEFLKDKSPYDVKGIKATIAVQLMVYVFSFLFSVLMVLGVKLEDHELIRPWLIMAFLYLTVRVVPVVYGLYRGHATLAAVDWVDPLLSALSFVCVYSVYKDIEEYGY